MTDENDTGPFRVQSIAFDDRHKCAELLDAIEQNTGIRDTIFSIQEVEPEAE